MMLQELVTDIKVLFVLRPLTLLCLCVCMGVWFLRGVGLSRNSLCCAFELIVLYVQLKAPVPW